MKKQELLNYVDDGLLEKLFGFCYARTNDSYEAQELCSDIVFALVKAAHTEGEIENVYSFIWTVARNVYADFCGRRRKDADRFYDGDADDVLQSAPDTRQEDDGEELLHAVYQRIAFLTKAYREVMILYYIDGLPVAQIAARQNSSENAVRQRLYSARQKIKNEVEEMTQNPNRPLALDKINFIIWGNGDPSWGDPRSVCTRMLSKHMVLLCSRKPMSAAEIAKELNVPTVYVEEELEILTKGENGEYGLLRRLENGKFVINFILMNQEEIEQAQAVYAEQTGMICGTISQFVEEHRAEYLAFPYLNQKADFNLILWQQVSCMARAFSNNVERILAEQYFAQNERVKRPFSVFGYIDHGVNYGGGWDSTDAQNVCGFSRVCLENIYITRIKQHFPYGWNVSSDPQIQLALRAIDGLNVAALSDSEKEHAAKAIQSGYLYREGDTLYTKILVSAMQDQNRLFAISEKLDKGYFEEAAQSAAQKLASLIKRAVPNHLQGEWRFANLLAQMPVLDAVVEALIDSGVLTPPEDGFGAEGCWMSVEK